MNVNSVSTTLSGRVASGKGDLAGWMREFHSAYEASSGVTLYPGSLNVVLESSWRLPDERIRVDASNTGVNVNLVPCTFMGTDAFIFRTDRDDAEESVRLDTLEIVSPIPLRTTFGLSDGDEVEIRY